MKTTQFRTIDQELAFLESKRDNLEKIGQILSLTQTQRIAEIKCQLNN